MARNRMLKKDFFGDPKIGCLPLGCRLLFQSLWIFADDTGHGIAAPQLLKAQAFPYDDITPDQVSEWMLLLSKAGMVRCYEVSGQGYFEVVNFFKHQIVNRPSHFAYPKPIHMALSEHSVSAPVVLTEGSTLKIKIKGKGERGKDMKGCADAHFANRKIPDDRFEAVRKAYFDGFEQKSPNLKAPFDASDGKMLKNLLERQSDVTCEDLVVWLKNAFASDDTPPLRPQFRLREFCAHAEKYSNGPLKRGGAPIRSAAADGTEAARLGELAQ